MPKEISLVLTSGGARGLAQIGAIEVLEEQGYKIKAIAGSSMGAVVGGLYATGKLNDYKKWVLKLGKRDVFALFDFTFNSGGFIKGDRLFKELEKILGGDVNIENANIPFYAVATDIVSNEAVWFNRGSLFKAIRASVAIPSIVTPVIHNGKILIDGGVSHPAPFDPLIKYGNNVIIINVNSDIPYEYPFPQLSNEEINKENSLYVKKIAEFKKSWEKYFPAKEEKKVTIEIPNVATLLSKSVDYMGDLIIKMNIEKHQPSMIIEVSRNAGGTLEFFKAEELIEAGRKATEKVLEKL